MNIVPKMRTIKAAAEEIKQADKDSAISEFHIRQLVKQGKLPHIKAGNKVLINMDLLNKYLSDPSSNITIEQEESPIKPINI